MMNIPNLYFDLPTICELTHSKLTDEAWVINKLMRLLNKGA